MGNVSTSGVMTSRTRVPRSTSASYSRCTRRPRRASFSVMSVSFMNPSTTRSASTVASMTGRMAW